MKHLLILIALLSSLSLLSAQEKSAKAALEASKALVEVMGLQDQMSAGFDAMMPMIDGQAQQLNLSQEQASELKAIYKAWFNDDLDHEKMAKSIIRIYAQTFSVSELKELTEFYKTPLGKKVLEKTPELMETSARMGMDEATRNQEKLMKRLEPFLEGIK